MTQVRRLPALVVIALVLAGGGLIDRYARSTPRAAAPEAPEVEVAPDVPTAAPASAGSSAWYCTGAGGSEADDSLADGTIVVANAGARPLKATVTVIPAEGDAAAVALDVPAAGLARLALADVSQSRYASAVVELDGGQGVVEMAAEGAFGTSVTPCASAASPTWYFAEGVTTRDATEMLLVLNPFPEDAVVDFTFATEEGQVTPQALTGYSIRGRGMAAIDVGEFVQRRESVATTVSARAGRLVVSRLQSFDGSVGREGMSVALGVPAPGEVWYFADGLVADGLAERFQVYNPGPAEAEVELAIVLDDGEAEPLRVTVPRESRVSVVANDETRIPKGVGHSVTARSTNGVGVVIERSIDSTGAGGRAGVSFSPGARGTASRWVLPVGQADEDVEEFVVFLNPGPTATLVSMDLLSGGLTPIPALHDLEVAPGGRRAIRMVDHLKASDVPLLVTSTNPVVIDRTLIAQGDLGLTTTAGVALRD